MNHGRNIAAFQPCLAFAVARFCALVALGLLAFALYQLVEALLLRVARELEARGVCSAPLGGDLAA